MLFAPLACEEKFCSPTTRPAFFTHHSSATMDAAPSNWHCSRFKEQESILGFRRIRSENSSGSSSFSSRSLRAKRRRKPACTASFPSYDGASVHILAISSFTETDHRLSYSCRRTGRAQGSLGCMPKIPSHLPHGYGDRDHIGEMARYRTEPWLHAWLGYRTRDSNVFK